MDKIKQASEEILKSYTQPLINSFGILTNTSLFHTAYTHRLLGFDLSLKLSYSPIPHKARFFSDSVLACSLKSDDSLTYFYVYVESAATIFGPTGKTRVPVPGNGVAIPKELPGGLNLPGVPFLIPQLNVGLFLGSELMVRYIPVPFKGTRVEIYGVGLKENLNAFGPLRSLPLGIAIGTAYQVFNIGDVVKGSNISIHSLLSKRILFLEPVVGIGYEMTKVNFNYQFQYKIPTPTGEREEKKDVKVSFKGENKFRIHLGCALRAGLTFFYLSYENALYDAFSLTGGINFR